MAANSAIEWTDHTFNPWWGCVKVSPGCEHCYAETFAKRVGQNVWGPAKTTQRRMFGDKHWAEPVKWNAAAAKTGQRARVFCASMADVFEEHPQLDEARSRLWDLIEATPSLDWLLLTKRPENMTRMAPPEWRAGWPDNAWAMTTVENQEQADKRVPELLRVPARVRGLSCEPLLGPVSFRPKAADVADMLRLMDAGDAARPAMLDGISWVICGGESGHGARPMHPDWARSLRDQCHAAGVPFLFKQWGEWAPYYEAADPGTGRLFMAEYGEGRMKRVGKHAAGRELDGRTWDEFPSEVARAETDLRMQLVDAQTALRAAMEQAEATQRELMRLRGDDGHGKPYLNEM